MNHPKPSRLTAADFHPEVMKLFDQYVHGALDRRGFLDKSSRYAAASGTTLTVKSYDFGLDATDASLATTLGTTSFTLPSGTSTTAQVHTFLPPANGGPGYLITQEWNQATSQQAWHAYALSTSGTSTEISLPHADAQWLQGAFMLDGSLWVGSQVGGGQNGQSTYDKLGASGWVPVTERDFWDARDQATQSNSVARSGPSRVCTVLRYFAAIGCCAICSGSRPTKSPLAMIDSRPSVEFTSAPTAGVGRPCCSNISFA